MADFFNTEVSGGYGHEGRTYTLGVNSGSKAIGFGISDQNDAIRNGRKQEVSLHLSVTPDQAEALGQALIAHAEAVRGRLANLAQIDRDEDFDTPAMAAARIYDRMNG